MIPDVPSIKQEDLYRKIHSVPLCRSSWLSEDTHRSSRRPSYWPDHTIEVRDFVYWGVRSVSRRKVSIVSQQDC